MAKKPKLALLDDADGNPAVDSAGMMVQKSRTSKASAGEIAILRYEDMEEKKIHCEAEADRISHVQEQTALRTFAKLAHSQRERWPKWDDVGDECFAVRSFQAEMIS